MIPCLRGIIENEVRSHVGAAFSPRSDILACAVTSMPSLTNVLRNAGGILTMEFIAIRIPSQFSLSFKSYANSFLTVSSLAVRLVLALDWVDSTDEQWMSFNDYAAGCKRAFERRIIDCSRLWFNHTRKAEHMIAGHDDNLLFERRVYVAEMTKCRLFHYENECNVVESLYIAYTISLGLWQKNCVDDINVARCRYYPVLSGVVGCRS